MAQDFIERFHKIEGNSVGERQRNLNNILKNASFAPNEKQLVLDNLKPKTYLENLLYIDVLVHLREASRLLEIFKQGNGAFVSKIMKQPWFFREAFGNVAPDTLVDEFLPLLSFSVKIKLFKSLPYIYTEEKIDEVFDYVMNRYGLFMATSFITACSSGKISDILKNKVKLSTHQLKKIYKKEPNLINVYLEEQKQYTKDKDSIFDNNFLTYLAQKDPVYFWELMNKHRFPNKFKFGRRTTKKVIPTKTQDIVDQPDKYIKYFRLETLVRKLNKQGHFKRVYYNLFPRKLEELGSPYSLCNVILKYYPKNDRYNLFTKTFEDIIKEDIFNYTSCIWDNLLQLIPDLKVRESWAQLKYRESSDEEYLKLYETQKAIALIKEKINTTSSVKSRSKLLTLLAGTCAVNKDLNALEEVLKYFCFRHKNDDQITRKKFIQTIEKKINLKELTAAHWKYIHEIFTIQSLNKEYNWQNSKFRIRHIEYLFTNDESEEDKNYFILEYLKEQLVSAGMTLSSLDEIENKEVHKEILLQALEHVDTLIRTHHKESDKCYLSSHVVEKVLLFNMKYPERAISIEENENIQRFLKDILKEEDYYVSYWFEQNFSKILCKLNRTDFDNELLKYYLNNKEFRQLSLNRTLKWYIKHDPLVVVDNFNSIMAALPSNTYHLWTRLKRYSHLCLDDKVIKHCLHKLQHGGDEEKSRFIEPLSILGTPELYIKTMEDLNVMPISSKVVVDDAETRKVYEIQKGFLKNFKNLWHPMNYLPVLLDKFCQGDYLRGSLISLYTAFHKIPENELQIYLDKLINDKAMSIKKNGLFLAMYVSDQIKVLQIFDNLQEDKNTSLQKCLCISSLRYFSKNQKQEYFEKLTSYMKFLKEYDVESLEILSTVRIPEKYKSSYIINFWELLEKLKMNPNAGGFKKLMAEVLNNMDSKCVQNLPEDFCKALINKYFGTNLAKEDEIDNIFNFVIKFLIHHRNQTDNFNYFTTLLNNYKSQCWHLKARERNKIHKFFNVFLTIALEEQMDLEFIIKFSTEWGKVFTPTDTFTEYVLLNMLRFKKQACDDMESYAKSIVSFAEQINAKYGGFVFSKFIHIVAGFCVSGNNEKEVVDLLTNILKFKISALSCILVMELITFRGDTFYQDGMNPLYREVNIILREMPDQKVQLCYNLYSKNETL